MDWSNERYVRLYVRDTTTWKRLGWDGQSLLMHLIRKVDRAGTLDLSELEPWEAIALITGAPEDVAKRGLEALLRTRTVEVTSDRPDVRRRTCACALPQLPVLLGRSRPSLCARIPERRARHPGRPRMSNHARRRVTVEVPGYPGASLSGCFRGLPTEADLEALRELGRAIAGRLEARGPRHVGDDPWVKYERGKAALAGTAASPAEYEELLRQLADKEGV